MALYLFLIGSLLSLIQTVWCVVPSSVPSAFSPPLAPTKSFDWDSVSASDDLKYHECYDDFQCARLSLPLSWKNRSSPHRISLATIRLPATVDKSHPRFGGSIVINPGGPGGSGVLHALKVAHSLRKLLGGDKEYEIVSFDPRGVFQSVPNAYCFPNGIESEIWSLQKQARGSLDSEDYAVAYHWASEVARGQLCSATSNGAFSNDNIRRHMSTASIARDMLELAYKIDQHASKETIGNGHQQVIMEDINLTPNVRLNFIGGSWGTFLGQTFASLYPRHVGRMVLDANLDADNWVSHYEASVDDVADIRAYFYHTCFGAGSDCALWREGDQNANDVQARFESLIEALRESPRGIAESAHTFVITADEIQKGFFMAVYQPQILFAAFADFVNAMINGSQPDPPFWLNPIPGPDTYDDLIAYQLRGSEASAGTHCSDGPDLQNATLTDFKAYLSNLTSRFPTAGALQAAFKMPCWAWPDSLRTQWRFDGPFGGKTPVLFLNNRLDPATPLKNAVKMSGLFDGSVVLRQDGVGHGVMFTAADCVWSKIKVYMDRGLLPQEGTVCPNPCETPFAGPCDSMLLGSAR